MMKKIPFVLIILSLSLFVSVAHAVYAPVDLPQSDIEEYNGYKLYESGNVSAALEFTVYDTRTQQNMSGLGSLSGYNGETFIYAYHIFNISGDPIDSVKVFGFNPDAVASEDDLSASDTLFGNATDGVEVDQWALDGDEATWFITDQEELGVQKRSWFMFIFSDYAPVAGDFEVNPQEDQSDPLIPGDNEVPEPATLVLLGCGAILSLRRKR